MRIILFLFSLTVTTPAFSDDFEVWQTSEVTVWPNGKILYAPQNGHFYSNERACESSLKSFFGFYPEGKIEKSEGKLFFVNRTGYSISYVHCIGRMFGPDIKKALRQTGKLRD